MILWPFFVVFLLTFHYRPTQQTSWYPKIKVLLLDISFQDLHLPLKVVRYPKISWSESEDSILHYCEEDIEIQILQSMELLSIDKRNFCAYWLFFWYLLWRKVWQQFQNAFLTEYPESLQQSSSGSSSCARSVGTKWH